MLTVLIPVLATLPAAPPVPDADTAFQNALIAAVHRFVDEGELDHLKAILERHPKLVSARQVFRQPRKPCYGDDFTPLHRAADKGRANIVAYLLDKGADVNDTDAGGWTPLHRAAQSGDLETVQLLVRRGARVEAKTKPQPAMPIPSATVGNGGIFPPVPALTPLDLAKGRNHEQVVEFLKKCGK
jgi:hypothetical protein